MAGDSDDPVDTDQTDAFESSVTNSA